MKLNTETAMEGKGIGEDRYGRGGCRGGEGVGRAIGHQGAMPSRPGTPHGAVGNY